MTKEQLYKFLGNINIEKIEVIMIENGNKVFKTVDRSCFEYFKSFLEGGSYDKIREDGNMESYFNDIEFCCHDAMRYNLTYNKSSGFIVEVY